MLYNYIITLWVYRRIFVPSLPVTPLCGAFLYLVDTGAYFTCVSRTIGLHLMAKLRMSGPLPPLCHIHSGRAEGRQLYLCPLKILTYSEFRFVEHARTHHKVSVHAHLLRDKSNDHFIHRHVTVTPADTPLL